MPLTLKNFYRQWWQPWANTIAYWKLDWDTTDELWNYDMVTRIWTMNYWTLSWWQKYGIFNGSTILSVASVPSWTKWTLSFWINKSWTSEYVSFVQNINTDWSDNYTQIVLKQTEIGFRIPWWSNNFRNYTQSTWEWHHIVLTQDWTGMCLYIDNVQIWSTRSNNSWFNAKWWNQLCIWWLIRWTQAYSIFNWYLSNMIIESEARTAQEVSDYYNLTKSLYGIS